MSDTERDVYNGVIRAIQTAKGWDAHKPELTLRDQFAMAALNGLGRDRPIADAVRCAYEIADAMLVARGCR